MFKNVTNWKSTIQGIVVLIVSVLLTLGVVSLDESVILTESSTAVIAGATGAIGGVVAIYKVFFAKDTPVEPPAE